MTAYNRKIKDIIGLFIIVASVLLFISLISYDQNDTMLLTSNPNNPVRNWIGTAGAYCSTIFFIIFGLPAYLIPIMIFYIGFCIFTSASSGRVALKSISLLVLVLLLSILFTKISIKLYGYKTGGIAGEYLSGLAFPVFGKIGYYVVLYFLIFLSIIFIFNISIFSIISKLREIKKGKAERQIANENIHPEKPLRSLKFVKPEKITKKIKKSKPPIISRMTINAMPEKKQINIKKIPRSAKYPPLSILSLSKSESRSEIERDTTHTAHALERTLRDFDIAAKVINYERGPVITRYELKLAPGIKVNRIVGLSDNIAMSLAAQRVRIVAPIPGKAVVGVEIPNEKRSVVTLGDIALRHRNMFRNKLDVALGMDVSGNPKLVNLAEAPHVLIAGYTGSGKSVALNSIICNLLIKTMPDELKFIMVDPKMVELKDYNGIGHLLTEVIYEPKDISTALRWLVDEMENRYRLMNEYAARDIIRFNKNIESGKIKDEEVKKIPYIVLIVDELADIMMVAARDVEGSIIRLAQKARAVGIHLILATQRPSVDVITGIIKANLPTRIAFHVASNIDSKTIIDTSGAEKLLGKGDLLLSFAGSTNLERIQGTYICDEEIKAITDFWKRETPEYIDLQREKEKIELQEISGTGDELYDTARKIIIESGKASASYLQRRLKIGYNRAARLIETFEEEGFISQQDGSKPRKILG